jgi:hypothetical protein
MIKFDFIKWSLLFKLASFSGYIIEASHYRNKSNCIFKNKNMDFQTLTISTMIEKSYKMAIWKTNCILEII